MMRRWDDLGLVWDKWYDDPGDSAPADDGPGDDYRNEEPAPKKPQAPAPTGYEAAFPGVAAATSGPVVGGGGEIERPDEPPPAESYGGTNPAVDDPRGYGEAYDPPDEAPPPVTYAHDTNNEYPDESRHGGAAGPDPYVGAEFNPEYNPRADQVFGEANVAMTGSPEVVGDPNDSATYAAAYENANQPRARQQFLEENILTTGTPGMEDTRIYNPAADDVSNAGTVHGTGTYAGDQGSLPKEVVYNPAAYPGDAGETESLEPIFEAAAKKEAAKAHAQTPIGRVSQALLHEVGKGVDALLTNPTVQEGVSQVLTRTPGIAPAVELLGRASVAEASPAGQTATKTVQAAGAKATDLATTANDLFGRGLSATASAADAYVKSGGPMASQFTSPVYNEEQARAAQHAADTALVAGAKGQSPVKSFSQLAFDDPAYSGAIDAQIRKVEYVDSKGNTVRLDPTKGLGYAIKATSGLALDIAGDPTNWTPQAIAPVVGRIFQKVPVLKIIGESRTQAVQRETREFVQALAAGDDAKVLEMQDVAKRSGFVKALTGLPGVGPKIEVALQRTPRGRATLHADTLATAVDEVKAAGMSAEDALKLANGDTLVRGAEGIGATGRKALVEMKSELAAQVNGKAAAEASFVKRAEAAAVQAEADGLPGVAKGIRDAMADQNYRAVADIVGRSDSKTGVDMIENLDRFGDAFDADPVAKAAENASRRYAEKVGAVTKPSLTDKVASNAVAMYKQGYLVGSIPTQVVNVTDNVVKGVLEAGGVATFSNVEKTIAGYGWNHIPVPLRREHGVTKAASAFEPGLGWENPYLVTPIVAGPVAALGKGYGAIESLSTNGLFKNRVVQIAESSREPFAALIPDIVRKAGLDPAGPQGRDVVRALQARIRGGAPFSGQDLVRDIDTLVRQGGGTLPHVPPPGRANPFVKQVSEDLEKIPAHWPPAQRQMAAQQIIEAAKKKAEAEAVSVAASARSGVVQDAAVQDYRKKMAAAEAKFHAAVGKAGDNGKAASIFATETMVETRKALATVRDEATKKADALYRTGAPVRGAAAAERKLQAAKIRQEGYRLQTDLLENALGALQRAKIQDATAVSEEGLRVAKKIQQELAKRIGEAQRLTKAAVDNYEKLRTSARTAKDYEKALALSDRIDYEWAELDRWMLDEGTRTLDKLRDVRAVDLPGQTITGVDRAVGLASGAAVAGQEAASQEQFDPGRIAMAGLIGAGAGAGASVATRGAAGPVHDILGIAAPRGPKGLSVAKFATKEDELAFVAVGTSKTAGKAKAELQRLGWTADEVATHGKKVREAFRDLGAKAAPGTKAKPTEFLIPDQAKAGAAPSRPMASQTDPNIRAALEGTPVTRPAAGRTNGTRPTTAPAAAAGPAPTPQLSPESSAFWQRRSQQAATLHDETQKSLDALLANYATQTTPLNADLRASAGMAMDAARLAANHWANIGEYATAKGYREVARVYNDYQNGKTGLDRILNAFFPFSMWQTRNPAFWGETILRNPIVGVELAKYFAATEVERNRRGLPASNIGMFSVGKPGEAAEGTALEGPAKAIFGNRELRINPVSPLFSITDQVVQVAKAYLDVQRAEENLKRGTGSEGDVTQAKAALAGSLVGGLGFWAPITEGATAMGLAGERQIGDPLPRIPAQNLITAGARVAGYDFDPQAPVRRFLTDLQYKQLGKAPPFRGDKFEDLAVTTALRDMRIRGEIPGANPEEQDANLYRAIQALRSGQGDKAVVTDPTLKRALEIADEGGFRRDLQRAVLPGRFHTMISPEQQAVYDAKGKRAEVKATSEAQKAVDDPRGYGKAYDFDFDAAENVAGRANSAGYKTEIEAALAAQQSQYFSSPPDRESGTKTRRDFIDDPKNALYKDYQAWRAENPNVQFPASAYAKTSRARSVYVAETMPAEGKKAPKGGKPTETGVGAAEVYDTSTIALTDSQADNAKADAVGASLDKDRAVDAKYPKLAEYQKAHPFGSQTAAQFQRGIDAAGLRKDYEAHKAETEALKKSDPLAPYIADFNKKHGDATEGRGGESWTAAFVHYMEHETADSNKNGIPDGKEVLWSQAGIVQRGKDVFKAGQPVASTPNVAKSGTTGAQTTPDKTYYDGSSPDRPLLERTTAESPKVTVTAPGGTTSGTTTRTGGGTGARSSGGGGARSGGGSSSSGAAAQGPLLTLPDGTTTRAPATATQTNNTVAVSKDGQLFIRDGNAWRPIQSDQGIAALERSTKGEFGLNLPPGVQYAGKDAQGNHKFVVTKGTDADGVPQTETIWVRETGRSGATTTGNGSSARTGGAAGPSGVRLGDTGLSATAARERLVSPEAQEAFNSLPASARAEVVGSLRYTVAKQLGKQPAKGDNPNLSPEAQAAFSALPEPIRDEITRSVMTSIAKAYGDADGDGVIDPRTGTAPRTSAPRAPAGPRRGDPPTNRPPAAAPAPLPANLVSPSQTYRLTKGTEPVRLVTLAAMREELGKAGYGGPWDDASVLAAYARTTGGSLSPQEGGATQAPAGGVLAPVDVEAERKKVEALVPTLTAGQRNDEGYLRSAWMKSGSPLDFASWLALVRAELAKPPSFQALRAMLVPT